MSDDSGRDGVVRSAFLAGLAIVVPLLITLIVLAIAFNYIYRYLDRFSDVLVPFSPDLVLPGIGAVPRGLLVELTAPLVLVAIILAVGLVANSSRYGRPVIDHFDGAVGRIPGVGAVYQSFRQMSDVMLDSETQNFREVVMVEYPTPDTYALAFVTSETPVSITDPIGNEEMRTLFLPMAPNPVMGGHVIAAPEERIVDVEMTVEEGVRALVTSGVAFSNAAGAEYDRPESPLLDAESIQQPDPSTGSGTESAPTEEPDRPVDTLDR